MSKRKERQSSDSESSDNNSSNSDIDMSESEASGEFATTLSEEAIKAITESIQKVLRKKLDKSILLCEKKLDKKLEKQDSRIDSVEQSLHSMQEQVSQLKKERDLLLMKINEKNIVIHGYEDSENACDDELSDQIEKFISKITKSSVVIDDAYRMGRFKSDSCRPVCVKLLSLKDKRKIMKCRDDFKKLDPPIKVSSDLPTAIRFAHKILFEKRANLEKNGSSGTICFKTNSITNKEGQTFYVIDGVLSDESGFPLPDSSENKPGSNSRKSKPRGNATRAQHDSKKDNKKNTPQYALRNSTTSQRIPTSSNDKEKPAKKLKTDNPPGDSSSHNDSKVTD